MLAKGWSVRSPPNWLGLIIGVCWRVPFSQGIAHEGDWWLNIIQRRPDPEPEAGENVRCIPECSGSGSGSATLQESLLSQ